MRLFLKTALRCSLLGGVSIIGGATMASGDAGTAVPATSDHQAIAGRLAAEHIKTFDNLDFNVFSNQQWDRLSESHAQDIAVHWPDGHVTHGIEPHIADLKALFTYAPDTRIKEHPVKIGAGEWTTVIGKRHGHPTHRQGIPPVSVPATRYAFSKISRRSI